MKDKTAYYLFLAAALVVAAVLEVLKTTFGVLPLQPLAPNVMYIIGVIITVLLLAVIFVSVRMTKLHRTVRMALLSTGAIVDLLYYYVLSGENTIYFLPVFAVAYLMLMIKTEE